MAKHKKDPNLPVYQDKVPFIKKTKRTRGRPRKVELLPASQEIGLVLKEKEKWIDRDLLLKKVKKDPNSLDLLDLLMRELAIEAASLSFERKEMERQGQDTNLVSSKKVSALKSIADLYFRKRDAVIDQAFDFKSKRMERLIDWLLFKVVEKSAKEAKFAPEQISILFENIAKKFDDDHWDKEALTYIKAD